MIVLKTTDDRQKVKELYKKEGIEFSSLSNCLFATEKQEVLGYCLFDLDKALTVHCVIPLNDVPLADGILRSTLHVGCERGVVDAFYSDTAPEKLFETLNFIKNKGEKRLDVDKLFQSCCGCK